MALYHVTFAARRRPPPVTPRPRRGPFDVEITDNPCPRPRRAALYVESTDNAPHQPT